MVTDACSWKMIGDMFDNTMTAQAGLHQHRQEPEKPQTSH
ncbi:hypothetical protein IFVP22_C220350 [Vibrio parahaemolyticus]